MTTSEEMARLALGDEKVNEIMRQVRAEVCGEASEILAVCGRHGRSVQDAADFIAAGLSSAEVSKRLQADKSILLEIANEQRQSAQGRQALTDALPQPRTSKNILLELADEQRKAAESLAPGLRYKN